MGDIEFWERERDILEMIALGSPTKEIAWRLEGPRGRCLQVSTVNAYIATICRKAKVSSRAQLLVYVLQTPACHVKGAKCKPGLHEVGCPCDSPYCEGMRRSAA